MSRAAATGWHWTASALAPFACWTAPRSLKARLERCVGELIHAALEGVIDRERLGVGKGKELCHDHARDAARRIDPEVRVVDTAPAQAASRPLASHLTGREEESESPLVLPVVDEREVHAAVRLCGLYSSNAQLTNLIPGHQRDRVGGENPRAIERAAVEDHALEAHVVEGRRQEPATAVEGGARALRLIGLLGERRIGTAILTLVDCHTTD